jgi:glycosyltransferase involved in cell wall biosynthesis
MTRSNRIIVVSPYRSEYGPRRVLGHVCTAVRQAGYEPIVVVPATATLSPFLEELGAEAIEISELGTFPRTYNLMRLALFFRAHLRAARRIQEVVKENNACAVYSISEAIFCAGLAARRTRTPSITHAIGMSIQSPKWGARVYIRMLRSLTDLFIACSSAVAAMFAWHGVGDDQCTVVHNGIDTHEVESTADQPSPVEYDGPRIGMVAAFDPRKGHELFVGAAAAVVQRFPTARFYIIGGSLNSHQESSNFERRVRALIDQAGLSDRFELTGFVGSPEVYSWIRAMDVIVVPSRTEAFAHALLEAMACGRPIVATRIEGNLDAFADGQSGRFADSSAAGLAESVSWFLEDPARAAEVGRNAAERARRYFSIDVTIAANAHAVRTLLTSR